MPLVSYEMLGIGLEASAEVLAETGAQGEVASRYLRAGGLFFEGVNGALTDEAAGHIMATVVGSALIGATISPEVIAATLLAAPGIALLPEIAAGLLVAGLAGALYTYGGEAFGEAFDLGAGLGSGGGGDGTGEGSQHGPFGSNLGDRSHGLMHDLNADPLVLDLDGDGIELQPLASSSTRFDLDGDGAEERVAWASPQDGFLAHDLNSNGIVDGIDELFGGANTDGFDELRLLDSNSDGQIDASDASFADLAVWRDLNSDGVSTPDEMSALSDVGIESIELGYSQVDLEVDGSIIARTSAFVRGDGSTAEIASVDLALDEIIPALPENADLTDLNDLPNLPGGLGMPDLRTAMFSDATLEQMVHDLVYVSQPIETFQDFQDQGFLDVIYRWAGVDASQPLEPGQPSYGIQAMCAFLGRPYAGMNEHQLEQIGQLWTEFEGELGSAFLIQAAALPSLQPLNHMGIAIAALDPNDAGFDSAVASILQSGIAASANAGPAYDYLDVFRGLSLDPATGTINGDFDAFVDAFIDQQPSFTIFPGVGSGGGGETSEGGTFSLSWNGPDNPFGPQIPWNDWFEDQGSMLFYIGQMMGFGTDYVLNVTGWKWLDGGYTVHEGTNGDDLLDFGVTQYEHPIVWNPWTTQTESGPTTDQMLYGYEGNDELRGNSGTDRLIGGTGDDLLKGGADSDFYVYASGDGLDRIIEQSGLDDTIYFSSELNRDDLRVSRVAGTNDLFLHFGSSSEGIILSDQWSSSSSAVEHFQFVGEAGLTAGDIASIYLSSLATSGADVIVGSWAGERLVGLDGNDNLSGVAGDDFIDGGTGIDTLDGGQGDDTLLAGAGNDTLIGGGGNDTYVFEHGDGQDIVNDRASNNWGGDDAIVFAAGIAPGDVVVTQTDNGASLLLTYGTGETVKITNTMTDPNARVEQVQFADGTVWTNADMVQMSIANNGGANTFYGSYDGETLDGGAGNDVIDARPGNDTLVGSAGNDTLVGGGGNDTYVFDHGDGQDVVNDRASNNWGGDDAIVFAAGIAPGAVIVTQADNGASLLLTYGTGEIVKITNTMTDSNARVEQVQFADGTIWTNADMVQMSIANNGGANSFYGSYDSETLDGGAGNDVMDARQGNDTLVGSAGNDTLTGGSGDDLYMFNLGDGQDVIVERSSNNWGGNDTIKLSAGILASDVTVTQADNGASLLLTYGTNDTIKITNTMTDLNARVEQVQFADGTIWTNADMVQMSIANNGGANSFYGSYDSETLDGGAGNDVMDARQGNDTLVGSAGNDTLTGGSGDDLYMFNLGDGQDVIVERSSNNWGGNDTIKLGAGILASDVTVTQADNGASLLLTYGTDDTIKITNAITDSNARVEQVQFADGTAWTYADLVQMSTSNGGSAQFASAPSLALMTDTQSTFTAGGNGIILPGQGLGLGDLATVQQFPHRDSVPMGLSNTLTGHAPWLHGGFDALDQIVEHFHVSWHSDAFIV